MRFLKTAFDGQRRFDFEGRYHGFKEVILSVAPVQQPHPPLWIETRDPATLEFCAREGINAGYFFLFPRRARGLPRYPRLYGAVVRGRLEAQAADRLYLHSSMSTRPTPRRWRSSMTPGCAYRGFLLATNEPAVLRGSHIEERARSSSERGEPGAAEGHAPHRRCASTSMSTRCCWSARRRRWRKSSRRDRDEGMFNCLFGEFNFGELAEDDLMRSIDLFGTEVIPRLRDFEPF